MSGVDHSSDYTVQEFGLESDWYCTTVSDKIEQGDLLYHFPVVVVKSTYQDLLERKVSPSIRFLNLVIVSQSCDLSAEKIENVILCPFYPKVDLEDRFDIPEKKNSGLKNIQKGRVESLYLLPPFDHPDELGEFRIVNFREAYAVPFQIVADHLNAQGVRPKYLPPYREHLAQAFGRYIMRIGFPKDLIIPD